MSKQFRETLLLIVFLLIAISFTFAIGEILIRIIAQQHLIYNIEMVKYAKTLKMRDPQNIVSHIHKKNISAKLMGIDISLNSLGNRGPDLTEPKTKNIKRILVIGSSITMGWGVPYQNIFTSLVEKKLTEEKPFGSKLHFEFANAGIGNYNTYFQYQLFLRQYPIVKPDMVVLHYFISDAEPRSFGRDNMFLKFSYLAAFLFDRINILKFTVSNGGDLYSYYSNIYNDDNPAWISTLQYITNIKNLLSKDQVPFFIMVIPDFHNLSINSPYQKIYEKITSTFQRKHIPTLNMFPVFQQTYGAKQKELWIQDDDPHPNDKGHALMADYLYNYIVMKNPMHLSKTENK